MCINVCVPCTPRSVICLTTWSACFLSLYLSKRRGIHTWGHNTPSYTTHTLRGGLVRSDTHLGPHTPFYTTHTPGPWGQHSHS